ncbi:MAG TPA: hypothetical protein VGR26_14675, partial [Acidimicrobiales bacterium]|nr:hypothetical protein [Acidimicrobiales bacterium]
VFRPATGKEEDQEAAMDLVVLAVTRSWTYWMAPVLVATGVIAVVAMAWGYYRKVLDPWYRLRDQRAGIEPATTAKVVSLAEARSSRERPAPRRLAA